MAKPSSCPFPTHPATGLCPAFGLGARFALLLGLLMTGCTIWESRSGTPPPSPAFTIAATPGSLQIPAGGSGYAVVAVTRGNGFSGAVTLSIPGLPEGVVASGSIPDSATTGYLMVAVDADVSPQTWNNLVLDGRAGALTNATGFQLTVAAPLPAMSFPVDLVNAGGGLQTGGTWSNTALIMEPLAHVLETNVSGTLDNQTGFLLDPNPSQP